MLVVDKTQTATTFTVTVSEINSVISGSTLNLFNVATNVSTSFDLPTDTSLYPERFNRFVFDTSTFSGLTIGTYTYIIKDANEAVTETGLLKVVDKVLTPQQEIAEEYVQESTDETYDDYVVAPE